MSTAKEKAEAIQKEIEVLVLQAQGMISEFGLEPADYNLSGDKDSIVAVIAQINSDIAALPPAEESATEGTEEVETSKTPSMVELQKAGRENFIHAQAKLKEAEAKK
jgi:hypothetical protein